MQRISFPPPNTSEIDLKQYRMNSDALLRSAISSIPQPPPTPTLPYDVSKLSNLSKLSSELLESIAETQELPDDPNAPPPDFDSDTDAAKKDLEKDIRTGSTKKSDSILAMIFKIVPIGVNIAKRGKTIATGFKEAGKGIVDLVVNAALLTAIIGIDSIKYGFQFGIYLFKLLLCSIKFIINCPKCIFFYFTQLYTYIMLMVLISICFIFDAFFMVKYFTGVSCVETFLFILQMLEVTDKFIYSNTSYHIIHYPDTINELCYNCNEMGDTSAFMQLNRRMFNHIFVDIPKKIGGPIGETITGVGHILSFLDIK